MYAEIIIPLALPKNYTWEIPSTLLDQIMIGMRVEVMLGNNKRYAGIVKKIFTEKPELIEITKGVDERWKKYWSNNVTDLSIRKM